MPITKEEVQHLAKLARIELTKEEVKKFQNQLSSIVDYVDKLKEIELKRKEVKTLLPLKNVVRTDEIKPFLKQEQLLEQAPERKDNYYKVKSVFQ